MPIDMDNMLPGFSSQMITAQITQVSDTATPTADVYAAAVLRDEEILDVGIIVTVALSGTAPAIGFGRHAGEFHLVASTSATTTAAAGTVISVSNGGLAWATTADTESERRLARGDVVTFSSGGGGDGTGRFLPFVIMRGAEPLDPIA